MLRKTIRSRNKRSSRPIAETHRVSSEWAKWGGRLFFCSGWIASIFLGVLDLPEKIVSFSSNAPAAAERTKDWMWNYKQYEGRFSSDPQAWTEKNIIGAEGEADSDEGEIQLSIIYEGTGRYAGEIHSKFMAEKYFAPWSRVMLAGEVAVGRGFSGEVWDVVNNEKAVYTRFRLIVEDPKKGTLRLIPLSANDGVFPGEVVLWPTRKDMSEGMRGKQFEEVLRNVTKKYWKPGEENLRKKMGDTH